MFTKKSGGVTVERNKVYSIDFAENLPAGALEGVFSVSNDGAAIVLLVLGNVKTFNARVACPGKIYEDIAEAPGKNRVIRANVFVYRVVAIYYSATTSTIRKSRTYIPLLHS